MKVPRHIVEARRRKLADLLQRHRYLAVHELCVELCVSEATMRRDLAWLQTNRMITRTYGGALADFNLRFPSFRQRRAMDAGIKQKLADRAYSLLRADMTVFLDGGTTVFGVAEKLRDAPLRPLTCVTTSLPAADLLAEVQGLDVHLLGGQLLHRQSVLIGRGAVNNVALWRFDLAICGAQGMSAEGLWNSQPEVVELQRAVLARAVQHVFLVDSSKLGRTTDHFLLPWPKVQTLLTDASDDRLLSAGIQVQTSVVDQKAPLSVAAPTASLETPGDEKTDLTLPVSLL